MLDVRTIGHNDIVAMINLMNEQHGNEDTPGYSHNEAAWISNTMVLYHKSNADDQAILLGCFDTDDNELLGFITGDVFVSMYDNRLIADLKDCVVAKKKGLVFKLLFDAFLAHYDSVGIPDWRFDSIKKSEEDRNKLVDFVDKHYGETNEIETFVSLRGIQLIGDSHGINR